MNPDDEFYVILTSNADIKRYTNNKATAFTFLIPGGYCLDGTWKVALWRLEIPTKLKQSSPVLIYSDLVTDTIIGDTSAPILTIISGSQEKPLSYTPTHLEYHQIKQKLMNEISILLVNMDGKQIELENANVNALLELHFVRKTI